MDNKEMEKRLQNMELAFIAYVTITQDLLPPAYSEDVDAMVQKFFEKQNKLGGCQINDFIG